MKIKYKLAWEAILSWECEVWSAELANKELQDHAA
jgi:hypothetical protein